MNPMKMISLPIRIVSLKLINNIITYTLTNNSYIFHPMVISPILVSFRSVTWIEYDITTGKVQAGFVSPDFTIFAEHPELKNANIDN